MLVTENNVTFTPVIDYNGLSEVLKQFVELYKVCNNQETIDKALLSFIGPSTPIGIITTKP